MQEDPEKLVPHKPKKPLKSNVNTLPSGLPVGNRLFLIGIQRKLSRYHMLWLG